MGNLGRNERSLDSVESTSWASPRNLLRAVRVRQWTKTSSSWSPHSRPACWSNGRPCCTHWLRLGSSAPWPRARTLSTSVDTRGGSSPSPKASTAHRHGRAVGPPRRGLGSMLIVGAVAAACFVMGWELGLVVGSYALISVAYTLWLKRQPVIELAAVASGFALRAIAGGVGTHVALSNWFLVVTSFGALFVVTGKRAAELIRLGEVGAEHRPVLDQYTPSFLRSSLTLTASVTVTSYCLWAFERTGLESHAHHLVSIELTVVPIILGVLYVLWLLDAGRGGAPEDRALHDHFVQVLGIVWLALFSVGLYG